MEAPRHRRPRPRCQICEAELPWHRSIVVIADFVFCSAHARQYHLRQRQGVTTEELVTDWSDTLDNWRERPRALDQERGTRGDPFNRLYFHQRVDGWVLFQRSYSYWPWQRPPGIRGNDMLAVNPQTGDYRRFVSVDIKDVLDDLRGIRPAPHQAELGPYWGRRLLPPGLCERLAHLYQDARGRLNIPALLQAAPFPVYGLADQPLGLRLCGLGTESSGFRLTSIHFSFSSPRFPQNREAVRLGSMENRSDRIGWDRQPPPFFFRCYRLSPEEEVQIGEPVIRQLALTIAQTTFTGEGYFWARPYPLSWFHLYNETIHLYGSAFGPSEEEVLRVLEGLVVLNERADLAAQYQRELDEEHERLVRQRRAGS